MGRHGGGSHSGGGGSSSSSTSSYGGSGGSHSGGNSIRSSTTPFSGCYNRCYYDSFGRYHSYYTDDKSFGTKSGWSFGRIFILLFITIHMFFMTGGFALGFIEFGGKVDGNPERIFIEDRVDILTHSEEEELIELFEKVYEKSGMPVALYTDDFSWKENYVSLEVYSEELYYSIDFDEDAMIILFTIDYDNIDNDFVDWEYDMYCGDDTVKCLSDKTFDKLLDNFQKAMSRQDLDFALTHSWNSVMDDLAKTSINSEVLIMLLFFVLFYGVFYVAIIGGVIKENQAYKYYKKHSDLLDDQYYMPSYGPSIKPKYYSKCPVCNEDNSKQNAKCKFCGASLKIEE